MHNDQDKSAKSNDGAQQQPAQAVVDATVLSTALHDAGHWWAASKPWWRTARGQVLDPTQRMAIVTKAVELHGRTLDAAAAELTEWLQVRDVTTTYGAVELDQGKVRGFITACWRAPEGGAPCLCGHP